MSVEHFNELRKVHQRARQTVDLVNHHHIDQPVLDVRQQPLQAGALKRTTRNAAIVVLITQQRPTLGALAGNVGLASLALRVQAVEVAIQPFFGRFSGVDGAAQFTHKIVGVDGCVHVSLRVCLRPKNVQPFHRVPVMARAIADSD